MLYWKSIKATICMLESRNIRPQRYVIYSNGLLLNNEIADFCNKHRIQFTLSYDAPNPLAVRSAVPSQKNIDCFLRIKKRCVNSVFNALNCNPTEGFSMLEKMFPETFVSMGVLNIFNDIPKDIFNFEEGQISKALDTLADEIVAGHDPYGNRYNFFIAKFVLFDKFRKKEFLKRPFPPCEPGRISLSIKFNGDIVLCHNDNRVVGNVGDTDITEKHLAWWQDLLPKNCLECNVLPICRNRCPICLYTEDKTEYVHCDILRQFYGAIMRNHKKLTESEIAEYRDLRYELWR